MKFKDFQAPVLFSSTFKALNLGEKNSSTFKDACEPCEISKNLNLIQNLNKQALYRSSAYNCIIVIHNSAQNTSHNLSCYRADNHYVCVYNADSILSIIPNTVLTSHLWNQVSLNCNFNTVCRMVSIYHRLLFLLI